MGKAAVQGSDERALVLLDSAGVMTLAGGKGNSIATREILRYKR
jgi:ABC-type metal ion transport system substrate-binding protein